MPPVARSLPARALVAVVLGASAAPPWLAACSAEGSSGSDVPADATIDGAVEARADARGDAGVDRAAPLDAGPEDSAADTTPRVDADADAGDASDAAPREAGGPEGTPCAPVYAVEREPCGKCGFHYRACLPADAGADAGGDAGVWFPWGYCQSELPGGCLPGDQVTVACGRCGTQPKVCQANCTWAQGVCTEPATAVCAQGDREFIAGLSCGVGGRFRTCEAPTCTWGGWGECATGYPVAEQLDIPSDALAGQTVTGEFELSAPARTLATLVTGASSNQIVACPRPQSAALKTRYSFVGVRNQTPRAARVSVWHSRSDQPDAAPTLDTIMAVYLRDTVPATDAERQACTGFVNDDCARDPCATSPSYVTWAGLTAAMSTTGLGDDGGPGSGIVTIPAGRMLIVYTGVEASAIASPAFKLNVRVESLE